MLQRQSEPRSDEVVVACFSLMRFSSSGDKSVPEVKRDA
jgi:hypothetical protein